VCDGSTDVSVDSSRQWPSAAIAGRHEAGELYENGRGIQGTHPSAERHSKAPDETVRPRIDSRPRCATDALHPIDLAPNAVDDGLKEQGAHCQEALPAPPAPHTSSSESRSRGPRLQGGVGEVRRARPSDVGRAEWAETNARDRLESESAEGGGASGDAAGDSRSSHQEGGGGSSSSSSARDGAPMHSRSGAGSHRGESSYRASDVRAPAEPRETGAPIAPTTRAPAEPDVERPGGPVGVLRDAGGARGGTAGSVGGPGGGAGGGRGAGLVVQAESSSTSEVSQGSRDHSSREPGRRPLSAARLPLEEDGGGSGSSHQGRHSRKTARPRTAGRERMREGDREDLLALTDPSSSDAGEIVL
jgi:hypothetical protein